MSANYNISNKQKLRKLTTTSALTPILWHQQVFCDSIQFWHHLEMVQTLQTKGKVLLETASTQDPIHTSWMPSTLLTRYIFRDSHYRPGLITQSTDSQNSGKSCTYNDHFLRIQMNNHMKRYLEQELLEFQARELLSPLHQGVPLFQGSISMFTTKKAPTKPEFPAGFIT